MLSPEGGWAGLAGWPGEVWGTPSGVGSPESAQAGDWVAGITLTAITAERRTLAARKPGLRRGRRETDALLQRKPVIRDLQFHLLRGRRQLIGTEEHDPTRENQDQDTD